MPGALASAARAAALVTQMAVITVLGGLLGRQLDARFATEPALLLVGLFGGFTLGMFAIFRRLTALGSPPDVDRPDHDDDQPR